MGDGNAPPYIKIANTWLIINVGGGPTPDKPTVTLRPPPDPNEISSFMNIRVADIQACYKLWKSRGATFLTEPLDKYGETRCYIRDPDGYIIEVGQSKLGSLMDDLIKRHMKASVVSAYGGPEVMKYQDMPDPELGVGDVLVKVAGIGINPEDMLERNGDLKDRWPMHFPAIIGLDVSGTVVATGDGVTDLKVGDRVCAWSYHTYAELVADKATLFAKVPETMDLVDAAAIPLVGVTGSQLISVASGLQSGQTVLVSGAAGAVGRCAVYMAKVSGAPRNRGRAAFSARPGG